MQISPWTRTLSLYYWFQSLQEMRTAVSTTKVIRFRKFFVLCSPSFTYSCGVNFNDANVLAPLARYYICYSFDSEIISLTVPGTLLLCCTLLDAVRRQNYKGDSLVCIFLSIGCGTVGIVQQFHMIHKQHNRSSSNCSSLLGERTNI